MVIVTSRVSDIDIMQYLDGELPDDQGEAEEVSAALGADEQAERRARSFKQLGECVRTYAELETDDAEPALARVWERIEGRLEAAPPAESPEAPAVSPRPQPDDQGLLVRLGEWLDSVRGHFITGGVAAAAAAANVFAVVSGDEGAAPGVAEAPSSGAVTTTPALTSQPPEVESLELYGGGSVLTIPDDDDDEDGGTAVIWLEDEPETEGPI